MRKVYFALTTALFLTWGLLWGKVEAVSAASLSLSPATSSSTVGTQFTVNLTLNPGNAEVSAADAVINFDSTRLEVSSVERGSLMSGMEKEIDNAGGKLTVYSYTTQPLQGSSATGTLATITFRAKSTGTAAVTFVCSAGSSTDSSVWNAAASDVIECGSNGSGSYTIGSGQGGDTTQPTNTPAPSATAGPTSILPTSTPSTLPETGMREWFLGLTAVGVVTMLLGLVLVF